MRVCVCVRGCGRCRGRGSVACTPWRGLLHPQQKLASPPQCLRPAEQRSVGPKNARHSTTHVGLQWAAANAGRLCRAARVVPSAACLMSMPSCLHWLPTPPDRRACSTASTDRLPALPDPCACLLAHAAATAAACGPAALGSSSRARATGWACPQVRAGTTCRALPSGICKVLMCVCAGWTDPLVCARSSCVCVQGGPILWCVQGPHVCEVGRSSGVCRALPSGICKVLLSCGQGGLAGTKPWAMCRPVYCCTRTRVTHAHELRRTHVHKCTHAHTEHRSTQTHNHAPAPHMQAPGQGSASRR